MSRIETIFLYGSLLHRTGNKPIERIISRFTRPLYRGYMHGRLYSLGNYPGVIESAQKTDKVFGMLVELSRANFCLPQLDKFEDYRAKQPDVSQYLRKEVEVFAVDRKKSTIAWCYVYNQPVNEEKRIQSGDWLSHLDNRAG